MSTAFAPTLIDELRGGLAGRVVTPADSDYNDLRAVADASADARPAAIVRVANVADVAATVVAARHSGAELAVRSGGHSGAGHGTTAGGVVIDLRDMNRVDVDPAARTAWAEAGATAAQVTSAAGQHGLAVGFGDTGSVGIGGITLGGGIGYLVRKHGLTIDALLAAEVVTAAGDVLFVDESSHPELFWAIRGGGGNFGVVTRFQYALEPLDAVTGGMLVLPARADVLEGFMAAAASAPDELSAIVNVMGCPPMPFVPEEHHGQPIILALMCWAGEEASGERALAPFRALATPLADLVRRIRYPEMYPDEEGGGPGMTYVGHTMFTDEVTPEVASSIVDGIRSSDAAMRAVQLRVLGGAMARVPADATAFAHRASRIMVMVVSSYEGDEDHAVRAAWVDDLAVKLQQSDAGAYVNFLHDEGADRVRAAYPGRTWDRLREVKAMYDPDNLFRRNQNVPPAEPPNR